MQANPRMAGIILVNALKKLTNKSRRKKAEQVAPGVTTEIPKLNEAGKEAQGTVENNIQNALDEIEEFQDEKLAESMMDDETKSLWQKAKSWISELGELARYLVSKGETGFKASKTSANAIRPEIQAMTVEQAKARFREVQSKLKTALKKMLGKESTPRTKKSGPQEKRDTAIRKAIFRRASKAGAPISLDIALGALMNEENTARTQMIEDIAKGVTNKAKGIEVAPEEKKTLASLVAQITKILSGNVAEIGRAHV